VLRLRVLHELLSAGRPDGRIEIEDGGDAPMTLACNLWSTRAGGDWAALVARQHRGHADRTDSAGLSRHRAIFQLQRRGPPFYG